MMLGDINFPEVNWDYPIHNLQLEYLLRVIGNLFIEQIITQPTPNQAILDLLFTDPVYINSIHVCETPISDHKIMYINI